MHIAVIGTGSVGATLGTRWARDGGHTVLFGSRHPDSAETKEVVRDDEDAKVTIRGLIAELGFDAVDAGPLARSRELEHLAFLWISLAIGGLGREIGFVLRRR